MELKPCEKCYTDLCLDGKWFHHDHLTTKAYMLKGGNYQAVELSKVPVTEDELVSLLTDAVK
ncbi:hypothetical protein [Vibrio algicola]|uniref:Uncharacterized protein n=1 Tax=Vibrio algicola TaxID=2662262 RepID=A0A5Q0THL4_9VIBR|nr:hypothetical protein [Vibrio algicola]